MRLVPWIAAVITFACGPASGQTIGPELTFEAASVKPAGPTPNGRGGSFMRGGPGSQDPGRITYTNVSLQRVLTIAFDVQADQISGPGWLDSGHFDIVATIPSGANKDQFHQMLQNLLKERFHLVFHREKKEFSVYELRVASGGPKLGTQRLKESAGSGDVAPPKPGGGRGNADKDGFPRPGPHMTEQAAPNGVAKMAGNQITMSDLAGFLRWPMGVLTTNSSGLASGRVVDKTGLTAQYDIRLEYQWPGGRSAPINAPSDGGQKSEGSAADPDLAPSLFLALQQQLGLRLDQTKAPLDVIVVDSADKVPVEN